MLTILLNMFFYLQWIPEGQSEVKDRLLVGLSDGEVLLMEGPDVRNSFSCDNGLSVESVVCYSSPSLRRTRRTCTARRAASQWRTTSAK